MLETPHFCELERIEIQYKFANHFETAVARAINQTGSVHLPSATAERNKDKIIKGQHTPDINLTISNNKKTLEVKQDGKGMESGNIFLERKTLEECEFDFILFVPSYYYWEGNEEKNFAYLFTKEQIRILALTRGKWINHAGDNWLDSEGNRKDNGGWLIRMIDIPETYEDKTFFTLSQEYNTTYATLQKEILSVWDMNKRKKRQDILSRVKVRMLNSK